MVNVLSFNKVSKKVRAIYDDIVDNDFTSKTKTFVLFFKKSDIEKLPFNPLYKISNPLLLELQGKSKNRFLREYKKINNNNLQIFYKTIIFDGNSIFGALDSKKKWTHELASFPKWFGEEEECHLIRNFHRRLKEFSNHAMRNLNKYQKFEEIVKEIISERKDVKKEKEMKEAIIFDDCPSDCPNLAFCSDFVNNSNLIVPSNKYFP